MSWLDISKNFVPPPEGVHSPTAKALKDKVAIFAGGDVKVMAVTTYKTFVMDDIRVLTYSIHRAKTPIKVFGRRTPKGFARGYTLVAGTIVTVANEKQPFFDLLKTYDEVMKLDSAEYKKGDYLFPKPTELKPFDLVVTFQNEYGHFADLRILGVDIMDIGETTSIDELAIETQMQYVAQDIELRRGPDWRKWKQYGEQYFSMTQAGILVIGDYNAYKAELAILEEKIGQLETKYRNCIRDESSDSSHCSNIAEELEKLKARKKELEVIVEYYHNLISGDNTAILI